MNNRMRKTLSWLAVLCSFICSIALRFSAIAAVQHAAASNADLPPAHAVEAEISAFQK
jgi:hypothetical protein